MRTRKIITALCGLVLMQAGCKRQDAPPTAKTRNEMAPQSIAHNPDPSGRIALSGKVTFVQDAANYTYVELEKDGEKNWAAGPKTAIKVGDDVITAPGMIMANFQSKSLKRSFESILFTSALMIKGQEGHAAPVNPHGAMKPKAGGHNPHKGVSGMGMPETKGTMDPPAPGSITKADGGYTVAEIYSLKKALEGKQVKVKGKIVKASGNILDTYWYHIQDGTGDEKTRDLTLTSQNADIAVGSIVTIEGTLTLDKNLGSGYIFEVLLEKSVWEKMEEQEK